MNYVQSTLYGLIQGVGEFLPISSSGHLALLPHFIGIKDPGVAFDLAMHLGTALAVICYFHKKILSLAVGFITGNDPEARAYSINIIIASMMTVILALVVKDYGEGFGRQPIVIGVNLIVFGLLMWFVDSKFEQREVETTKVSSFWKHALLIGLAQAVAVFPGVSRSGATLSMSRALKMDRTSASEFSFILSLPVIIGGLVLKLPELTSSTGFESGICLWGVFVSFVTGLVTIHFFLELIKRVGLWPYTFYRVILGLVIITMHLSLA